jgi:hypothetical protein
VFCITLKSSILTKKEGPGDDGGRCAMARENHWLPGFNFNVEEWGAGDRYETLAICRSLELARVAFAAAIAEKPAGRFMIPSRARVVKRHPEATGEVLNVCGLCLMGNLIRRYSL